MPDATKGQASIHIEAPPEKVYAVVSDVTRTGEWSPECLRCEWLDGATEAKVGARFKGSNKRGWMKWSTRPEVTAADPGKEFAFKTKETQWAYRMTPSNGGTELTEAFEVYNPPGAVTRFVFQTMARIKDRQGELESAMQTTLTRIKSVVEGSA